MKIDCDQFWKLLEPIHPRAEGFCRTLTGNREDGDDLYQESLVLAIKSFNSLRNMNLFRSWLYRIIINRHKNRCQQPWWRRRVSLTPEMIESAMTENPRDTYSLRRWLERALSVLSSEDKSMVLLCDLEGRSVSELARVFNKPEGTIKARLSRARQKMRRAIKPYLPALGAAELSKEVHYALSEGKSATE